MAEAIRMPRMSDTMTEGVIVEWHKKVGDKIKPGDFWPMWKQIRQQWNWKVIMKELFYTLVLKRDRRFR